MKGRMGEEGLPLIKLRTSSDEADYVRRSRRPEEEEKFEV